MNDNEVPEGEDAQDREMRKDSTVLLEEEEEEVEGTIVEPMEVDTGVAEEVRRMKFNMSAALCVIIVTVGVAFVVLGTWVFKLQAPVPYQDFLRAECQVTSGGVVNLECKVECDNPTDELPCAQYGVPGVQVYWQATLLHRKPPISTTLYGNCYQEGYGAQALAEEARLLNTTTLCYYNGIYNWATMVQPPPELDEKNRNKSIAAVVMGILLMTCGFAVFIRRCIKDRRARRRNLTRA